MMGPVIESETIGAMNIPFTISIAGAKRSGLQSLIQGMVPKLQAELKRVDERYSPFRPDSLLNRWRSNPSLKVDAEFQAIFESCSTVRKTTAGFFDAEAGSDFDPTGYVKGWCIERFFNRYLAPLMNRGHVHGVCLNGGGDMQFAAQDDFSWQIGIEDPLSTKQLIASYQLTTGALATSGISKRGRHIAVKGSPDLLQVSVCAEQLLIIAGGMGVVPLLSIIEHNPQVATTVLYSTHDDASRLYPDKFAQWQQQANFTAQLRSGRFSDAMVEATLPTGAAKANLVVLIGGPFQMGRHWISELKRLGVKRSQIYYEEFNW